MNTHNELDSRLLACTGLVREGSIVADIGSDHAYLPIYLVKNGICRFAIASDINEGPVKRAKTNIGLCGLSDKIAAICADGLDAAADYKPDDIVIAGMGGELICSIIAASGYVKEPGVRLILQPMTMPEILRNYLAKNGFKITDEKITVAADKCYQIICAEFDGITREFTNEELLLGRININRIKSGRATCDDFVLLERTLCSAKRRIEGKKNSKSPDAEAIAADVSLAEFCESLLKHKEAQNNANQA